MEHRSLGALVRNHIHGAILKVTTCVGHQDTLAHRSTLGPSHWAGSQVLKDVLYASSVGAVHDAS